MSGTGLYFLIAFGIPLGVAVWAIVAYLILVGLAYIFPEQTGEWGKRVLELWKD